MTRAAAVLLLALPACAGVRRPPPDPDPSPHPGETILCVSNQSEGVGTIRVWLGNARALTVQSGRRECRHFRLFSGGMQLYAESMGGGLRGPVRYQTEITTMGIPCWEWDLRDSSASEIRLVPCES